MPAPAARRRERLRTLPLPTARGWGLLAAGIAALVLTQLLRRQELAYLACFLLALPLFSLAWVAWRRLALTVRRRFDPESGAAGQLVLARLRVQNWGSLRTPALVWRDGAPAPLLSSDPAVLPALPGYTTAAAGVDEPVATELRYPVDTAVRGEHAIGPVVATLVDPFGCARRRVLLGGTDLLVVTPAVHELARIDLRLASGDGAEQVSRRLVGAGEQDVIARKYLPGDSMRRVHWPATAKHGELMVRQDDQRNDQDAVVLLDGGSFRDPARASSAPAADDDYEWAVSAVASIAAHLLAEGFGVRLVGHRPLDGTGGAGGPGGTTAPGGESRELHTAVSGIPTLLRELAGARPDALADPAAFRAAVEQAALTSPDAPPVFALVGPEGADRAAARLAGLAAMSSHPVAFIVGDGERGGVGTVAGAALAAAGWTVVAGSPGQWFPALWKSLGDARGV